MTEDERLEVQRLKARLAEAAHLGRRIAAEGGIGKAKGEMARVSAQALILVLDDAKKLASAALARDASKRRNTGENVAGRAAS